MDKIPVRQLKETFPEERFNIRSVEPLTIKGDLVHGRHRHDFYFVLFIEKGKGEHEIDFTRYKVDNYSVFFIRPGQVHQLELEKGTTGFMLQFTSDFYAPRDNSAGVILRKISNKNYCRLRVERFEEIGLLLRAICQEFTQKQDRYKEAIRAYLDILFISLARQSANPNRLPNKTKLYAQERLEEFMDLVEKNIYTIKQVSDYANMLALTTYQLNAITKSMLQKTTSKLINEHIILEAKRLLIATGNQVNQVAERLGYEDPSYFIRFFKKQTGLTPEAFRQNFR